MTAILVNCSECLKDNHDQCKDPQNCLCAVETKHNAPSLKDGVRVDFDKPISDSFYQDVKNVNDNIRHEIKTYENDDFDLVADLIQEDIRFVTLRESEKIWYYNKQESIYKPNGETIIKEKAQELIRKCKKNFVLEVIDHIRRNKTYIDSSELFESRHINTLDGILDAKTFQVLPHSPEYLTTSKLPFHIATKSNNYKLWRHILTIIDPKDINLIMELIWICITNNNPFKKCFVFKGESNTQKSTLADILVWIIGKDNVSREIPKEFLGNNRFSTSKFLEKRINMASEIGNLTESMLEKLKSLIGAELQNTERKNDNTERYFDPTKFVFLFTTNKMGEIYSKINDNSIITRFQFLIFRNRIDDNKTNGQWYDELFTDEYDKQTAIDTVVRLVLAYKKKGIKTKWSNIAETKQILKEEQPKEDKYFEDGRLIPKEGSILQLTEIIKDFESFVGYKVTPIQLGHILKKNGMVTSQSNSKTVLKGYSFPKADDQTEKMESFN